METNAEGFAEFERTSWARRSAHYDQGFGRLAAGAHGALLDAAGAGPGVRLLEVGCGTGRLAAAALARRATVVATDAAQAMTVLTAGAAPGASVLGAALPDLPFAAGSFDAAAGAFVINHAADPPAAVAALARVVRPGGAVALSCWDAPARNRAQGVISDAIEAVRAAAHGLPRVRPFSAYATPDGFAGLLRAAGLREVSVTPVTWTHRVEPGRWWQDVLTGTVLTAEMIELQDPDVQARVRAVYTELARGYLNGQGLAELPAVALVASGRR